MNSHNRKRQQAKGPVQAQKVSKPEMISGDKKSKGKHEPWATIPRSMDPWNKEYRRAGSTPTTSMTNSANAAGSSSAIANHHTTGNSESIDNAPTSLSNLAQLSGITLLPMSKQRHVTSNTAKNQHLFSTQSSQQSKFSNEIIRNPGSSQKSQQSRQNQHQKVAIDTRVTHSNVLATQPTRTETRMGKSESTSHNLIHLSDGQTASISLPSLSRAASKQSARSQKTDSKSSPRVVKHRTNTDPISTTSNMNGFHASRSNGSKRKSNADAQHRMQQPALLLSNNVQLIPVTEPYKTGSYLSNDGTYLISNNSMKPQDEMSDNFTSVINTNINSNDQQELGITNDSLIQLMAVLSNPALTITPVDMSAIKNTSNLISDIDTMENIGEATITAVSMPADFSKQYLDNELDGDDVDQPAQSNARLPKSAANLQMVYRGCSPDPLECWSNSGEPSDCPMDLQSQVEWPRQDMSRHEMSIPDDEDQDDSCQVAMIEDMIDPLHSKNYDAISDSVKNLILSQRASNSNETPTVSVQLLRLLAEQARDIDQQEESKKEDNAPQEETQNLSKLGRDMKEVYNPSMVTSSSEMVYVEEDCLRPKLCKQKQRFNKRRLYDPYNDPKRICLDNDSRVTSLRINIESLESRQVYLSEKHQVLEDLRMMRNVSGKKAQSNNQLPRDHSSEPYSKISASIERRKRMETILENQEEKNQSIKISDSDFDCSGVLSFYDPSETLKLSNYAKFVTPNLSYEEESTPEKEDFMKSVGLLSRYERNKLSLDLCEKKMRTFTALALEQTQSMSSDVQRFARMIEQTGGHDIQMKIDTNIKRNDLPLLEGLNRNTSRIKINYMSLLGLDKRSKRTTLYKVGRNSESATSMEHKSHQQSRQETTQKQPKQIIPREQNDLSNKTKCSTTDRSKPMGTNPIKVEQEKESSSAIVPLLYGFENFNRAPLSTIALSCREAMNKPSKQDYMRSLGLISS